MRTDAGVETSTQRLWGVVMAVLLALAMTGAPPAAAQEVETEVTRIDGGATAPGDVRAIAIATCQTLRPDSGSAERVLLSRDDVFADALAASALAGDDSCILYTGAAPAGLDPSVRAEIDRVLPDGGQIELLGGVSALHSDVEGELVTDGYSVRRLEGATRYETAVAVAEVVRTEIPQAGFVEVVLAWGDDWPDAVTAGAYAAAQGVPIVLTQTGRLHPAAQQFLQDGPQIDRTSVIGGTAVISDEAAAAAPNAARFAGLNRMGTAATIASSLWPSAGGSGVDLVAVNLELPNAWTTALTAAPLSAQLRAPQVGVATDRLPDETAAYLDAVDTDSLDRSPTLTVMGDQSFVSDAVTQEVAERLAAEGATHAVTMTDQDLGLLWAIARDQELPCGGDEMGGGALAGEATFAHLGVLDIDLSAAWDIEARVADPDQAQFEPQGPAGGPFAPVLGPDEHPYHFQYDPFTDTCAQVVSATGEIEITAVDGDQIFATVTGGETHRLDYVVEGDGVETFAIAEFAGGTGRFDGASGSFVIHSITRFDFAANEFLVELVEMLPGGTISY